MLAAAPASAAPAFEFSGTETAVGVSPIVLSDTPGPNSEVTVKVILRDLGNGVTNISLASTLPTGATFVGTPALVGQGGGGPTAGTCTATSTSFSCTGGHFVGSDGTNIVISAVINLNTSYGSPTFAEPFADMTGTDVNGSEDVPLSVPAVPIASGPQADSPTAAGSGPTTFSPLANDVPPPGGSIDGSTLALLDPNDSNSPTTDLIVTGQGEYVVNPSGSVTFTPANGFTGPATPVTYQANDSNGNTDSSTITVTVAAVVASPLLNPWIGGVAAGVLGFAGLVLYRRRSASRA
jgi:CshA-type fibril repeat protein